MGNKTAKKDKLRLPEVICDLIAEYSYEKRKVLRITPKENKKTASYFIKADLLYYSHMQLINNKTQIYEQLLLI